MKTRRRLASKREAKALRLLRDKVTPGPKRGTHVGGGHHVTMPNEWNREGVVPPGWSGYNGEVEEFDFSDTNKDGVATGYRVDFPEDLIARISRSPEKFTEEERLLLETEFALCDKYREDGDPEPPRPKTVSDIARELKRREREAGK